MSDGIRTYRADVDGLRAVAVLSVVFCHAGFSFTGGYVGVDVFFVISGYLITGIILRERDQETFSFLGFWERRVRRILPPLVVVTTATLVAGWFLLIPREYLSLGKSVVGLAALSSNVWFSRESGYFAPDAGEKPLLHTWSLAVEEQFYLLFPLLLILVSGSRRPGRAFVPIALIAAASLAASTVGVVERPSATFYLLPARAWELLAGSLLAIRSPGPLMATSMRREAASALGLFLILGPCFFYGEETPFPGPAALPPVLGAALLILAGGSTGRLPWASRLLTSRPMVAIGTISYSLYLWHWPLFAYSRAVFDAPPTPIIRSLFIVASLTLAYASWRFVEVPCRERRLLATGRQASAFAASAFVGMLGVGLAICANQGFEGRISRQARVYASTGLLDPSFLKELEAEDVPVRLIRLGGAATAPEVLVWGDSHAMAVLRAFDAICRDAGTAGRAATHSSTAPVLGHVGRSRNGINERAAAFNAAVADYVVKSGTIRSVVLVARWEFYFKDRDFPAALAATVDVLAAAGVDVYFMKDVPFYEFSVPEAAIRYDMLGWDDSRLTMTLADFEASHRFYDAFLPGLEQKGVEVLDPIPFIYPRGAAFGLRPFDAGGSFYRDAHHLSTYGALALKPLFAPLVGSLRAGAALSRPGG